MYPEGQEILVVIDDGERRERVARLLGVEGFAVTAAAEGLAALRALAAKRFALMVAAARLPGSLDGRATVRQARVRQPWLKALLIDDGREWHDRGNPDIEDFIGARFERHELIGCTFELLQRTTRDADDDLWRRARTTLPAS